MRAVEYFAYTSPGNADESHICEFSTHLKGSSPKWGEYMRRLAGLQSQPIWLTLMDTIFC